MSAHPSVSPGLGKRARGAEGSTVESAEKRQRIEVGPPDQHEKTVENLAAIVARAAAAASEASSRHLRHSAAQSEDVRASIEQQSTMTSDNGEATRNLGHALRVLNLPTVRSLILAFLACRPYLETIKIVTYDHHDLHATYLSIKGIFDETLRIYRSEGSFVVGDGLSAEQLETVRLANLVLFATGVFAGNVIEFHELNESYLDIFTEARQALSRPLGELHVNLKTQMYLAGMSQEPPERGKEDTLRYLFPDDWREILQDRHESPLSEDELYTLQLGMQRRQLLESLEPDVTNLQILSEQFPWEGFLAALNEHLTRTCGPMIDDHLGQSGVQAELFRKGKTTDTNYDDIAKRAADSALQAIYGMEPSGFTYVPTTLTKTVPYPTQSAPTQVLYERARLAAAAKHVPPTTPVTRRPGLQSFRRPWSTDEENALMAGLDHVKGPHWSQILALYGTNGVVSQILRDRNQVQLKDKARNLKMFFLKSQIEVPYYLSHVTGDLRTRAPMQAARLEAEGKASMEGQEDLAEEEEDLLAGMTEDVESFPTVDGDVANLAADGCLVGSDLEAGT